MPVRYRGNTSSPRAPARPPVPNAPTACPCRATPRSRHPTARPAPRPAPACLRPRPAAPPPPAPAHRDAARSTVRCARPRPAPPHRPARYGPAYSPPSSPNAAASGAPPQPTESSTTRNARGIRRTLRYTAGGRSGISSLIVNAPDSDATAASASASVAACTTASGMPWGTLIAQHHHLRQARPTDRSGRQRSFARRPAAPPPGPAPRRSIAVTVPVARRLDLAHDRRRRQPVAPAIDEIRRAAHRRDHCAKPLCRGARLDHLQHHRRPFAPVLGHPRQAQQSRRPDRRSGRRCGFPHRPRSAHASPP